MQKILQPASTQPRRKRLRYGVMGALVGSAATYGAMRRPAPRAGMPKAKRFSMSGLAMKGLRRVKNTKLGYRTLDRILASKTVRKAVLGAI